MNQIAVRLLSSTKYSLKHITILDILIITYYYGIPTGPDEAAYVGVSCLVDAPLYYSEKTIYLMDTCGGVA